jgi:DNA-binding NarL/FixJ family response regulator
MYTRKHACCSPAHSRSSASEEFLPLLPIIERHADLTFRDLPASEREEYRAEAVAAAFQSFCSLIKRGKNPLAFPTLMATRAVQHVQAGRRVGGRRNGRDVLGEVARRRHGFEVRSLERSGAQEAEPWRDALVDNTQTAPDEAAAFRCDFPAWLQTLSPRDRKIVDLLALGHAAKWVAEQFGFSQTRVHQLRTFFREGWNRFHGEEQAAIA